MNRFIIALLIIIIPFLTGIGITAAPASDTDDLSISRIIFYVK